MKRTTKQLTEANSNSTPNSKKVKTPADEENKTSLQEAIQKYLVDSNSSNFKS